MPEIVIWCCSSADIEEAFFRHTAEQQAYEYFHAIDLAIEQELGEWPAMDGQYEEAPIEYVPIELVEG